MPEELILVVDDNRQSADFLANSVLPSLGYSALKAYGGESALKTLRGKHQDINLMLLDLQMPGLNGLDLLKITIRDHINVPAIMITAHSSEQMMTDALQLGVYDYLKKPVDIEQLHVAIERVLNESRLRAEKRRLTNQLKEQISWLTALSDVGRSVTSSLDINIILRRILEASVSLTQADQGFIALREPNTNRLYLRAVKNIVTEGIENVRLPVNDPLFRKALISGNPVRKTRDKNTDVLKVTTGLLVYSLIHVPILYQGHPLGILSMNNHAKQLDFSEKDESILITLADYAGIAIGNANSFQKAKQEIEERRRVEAALRESEERYALAVQGSNDGVWDWDLQKNRIYFAPRWKQILGYEEDEISDDPDEWFDRIYEDDLDRTRMDISTHIHKKTSHFINEHRLQHKDGSYRWVLSRGIAVWNESGEADRLAGSMSDITDRKVAEERLLHDALHDTLTGLPNRALFMDRLHQALERSKRTQDYQFCVLFLDLDNFKHINDSIGHVIGDQLLIEVAASLKTGLRSIDTLARFGGDEFVILLDGIEDMDGVGRVTDWIMQLFENPFKVAGHEVITSASIGIVLSQEGMNTPEEIIRNADIAMYQAKDKGKSRAEIFDPSMRQRFLERLGIETDLRKAFENDQLHLQYQPIVNLNSGEILGFESLVRWRHPKKGLIPPSGFINIAEETGLIVDIDHWVLRQACTQINSWNKNGHHNPELSISVNISGIHITSPELHDFIKQILKDLVLKPECLHLEITELSIVDQNEFTARSLSNLQNLGIKIQIDDFGIGYSSLAYLSRFPIDALKIDQSFVNRISVDRSQRDIVQAIITLAKSLDVNVIAEGVETQEQLKDLLNLGCELGQGYLFSPPVDSDEIDVMLSNIANGDGKLKPKE